MPVCLDDGYGVRGNQWRSRRTESVPDFAPDAFVLGVFEAFAGFDVFTFEVEVFDLLADFAVEVLADEAEERRATLLFEVRRVVEEAFREAFSSSLTFGPSTPSGVGYS